MAGYLSIGKIVAVHGLKGELLLKHELGKKTSLKGLQAVFIEDKKDSFIPWFIESTSLVLHLLAPNHRAVQVTTDLTGFWERHYPAIARELRRKYPRHAWPDDPLTATPPTGGRPR